MKRHLPAPAYDLVVALNWRALAGLWVMTIVLTAILAVTDASDLVFTCFLAAVFGSFASIVQFAALEVARSRDAQHHDGPSASH